jgi:deoxycytidine triphosphate deaminase
MLTINNQYKIVAESFVVSKKGMNEHWTVDDITETPYVYDIRLLRKVGIFDTIERTIRVNREKNKLEMYSVHITAAGHIIDKDQIRVGNIQTTEGMLNELKTIMEFI